MLAHALRATRQRAAGHRVLAAATAAWQLLQPAGAAASGGSLGGTSGTSGGSLVPSGGTSSWLKGAGSFSSSAVLGSTPRKSSNRSSGKGKRGPKSHTAELQPRLQAWLQQEQGLSAADADEHARRLALVFGSQQAALDGLPATFEWCCSRGLTGLQTAQLLDHIANKSHKSVAQFAALVQPVWQLMDSYVAAWAEQQHQAGGSKQRKHISLAKALCSNPEAAKTLAAPAGHVEAWLAAVSEQLPAAAVGSLLLGMPNVVCGGIDKGPAVISWAASELGVTDPAAFFARSPGLLMYDAPTLQRNLDSLQQALGVTAEQVRQLVLKQPRLLASSPDTVQAALVWLRQLFPDAAQLAGVIDRGALLLTRSAQRLQGNADYLQQALGWQEGDGQLAAFVAARPADFGTVNLSDEDMQQTLRLLSEVVGVSTEACLSSGISYLNKRLVSIAARYMLVQERAPYLLCSRSGELSFSWVKSANKPYNLARLGMSRDEFNAFVRAWPASPEGRRLLAGLRAGSVAGWPRPPSWEEAQQQRRAALERQRQTGKAAAAVIKGKGKWPQGSRAQSSG
ncbi:transcription termination factor mitochondrial [Chlorella sorokiniana]|uniref:Transcription termination factor mitochondrial n=1 Tax=Chlorella sorokiniana TaxID=3076 RepID=A0A2P6TND1_CHLSO|nr:transcription termination factor mitochondrial [Chlorella sorokiniana]|eukprot:PRW50832.1 transcription termination factor mitochondrial [Chlorella sorokiniana]